MREATQASAPAQDAPRGNAELSPVASVVRTAGELDETGRGSERRRLVDVAKTGAVLVVPREVRRAAELVDRLERATSVPIVARTATMLSRSVRPFSRQAARIAGQ